MFPAAVTAEYAPGSVQGSQSAAGLVSRRRAAQRPPSTGAVRCAFAPLAGEETPASGGRDSRRVAPSLILHSQRAPDERRGTQPPAVALIPSGAALVAAYPSNQKCGCCGSESPGRMP